jgi:hypothetical protein
MSTQLPTGFFCPVCGDTVEWLWVWREPDAGRIRIYCRDCATKPEYRGLREEERLQYSEAAFARFAAERLLRHVFAKEHAEV